MNFIPSIRLRLDLRKAELLSKLDPNLSRPGGAALFNYQLVHLIQDGTILSKDDKIRLATHTVKFSDSGPSNCQ